MTNFPLAQSNAKKKTFEILIHKNSLSFFFPRELCEESMTHSVSSASSLDSHAPSESSGQSQGMRWEEQQKLLALEQLCGVFRVDLGHMRSLRLFFRSAWSTKASRGEHEGTPCSVTVHCLKLFVLGLRMVRVCFMIISGNLVPGDNLN